MPRCVIIFILLLCCISCARPGIRQTPPAGNVFQALVIKFNFSDGRNKQNGKIHWRFDAASSKFLFFTPLNQVGLELDVEGENALLLRPENRLFWRGEFSDLIKRLWDIELTLDELKRLVGAGSLPEEKMRGQGIEISLETNAGDHTPRLVHIRHRHADLTLKIVRKEIHPGSVVFLDYRAKFQEAGLEEVLGDD
jgi:hypothetical protein